MADKKSLVVPLALAAAAAVTEAPAASPPTPKVLRVLARAEATLERAWASEGASPVSVTSRGLGNVVHVIGGAG
jgi:hypothetical protein